MSDKSSKLCICTPDAYGRMGDVHVTNDKVVSWEEVKELKKEAKGHLRCLNLMFQLGSDQGEAGQDRAWRAK